VRDEGDNDPYIGGKETKSSNPYMKKSIIPKEFQLICKEQPKELSSKP